MKITLIVLTVAAVALSSVAARAATPAELIRLGDSLMQQSRDALDPSRYAPARDAYERALALDPKESRALLGLAWVANSEHRFDEGARWCHAALAVDDKLPDAHALLGDRAVELGEYDAAFDHYQRALDLRPDLSSYSRAAHLLWITGEPQRARELMRAAIAAGGVHAENTAWCAARLALMHWEGGELAEAEVVVKSALERVPNNAHLLHAASRVAASRDEIATAIDLCERSVAAAPTHDALADLVELYRAASRRDDALRQFARVLEFQASQHAHSGETQATADSSQPHFHGNAQLARFLADQRQNLDGALGEAEAAVAATPNVDALDTLAWCYHQLGRRADATKTIERALHWHTPSASLHFHAGMIYAEAGSAAKAREHLERALELNSRFHPRFTTVAKERLDSLAVR